MKKEKYATDEMVENAMKYLLAQDWFREAMIGLAKL